MDILDILIVVGVVAFYAIPEIIGQASKKKRLSLNTENPEPDQFNGSDNPGGPFGGMQISEVKAVPVVPDVSNEPTPRTAETASVAKAVKKTQATVKPEPENLQQGYCIEPKKLIIYSAIMKPKFDEV